jgi:hypothetical protein
MSSYEFGDEVGTDQINMTSVDIRDYLSMNGSNQMSQINTIRDRELRLLKKIKHYTPQCPTNDINNNIHSNEYCKTDFYLHDTPHEKIRHRDVVDNVEDNYFSGRQIRGDKCIPNNQHKNTRPVKKKIMDNFTNADFEYLNIEMEDLEKRNDSLVLFIFFLVIIVILQYSKINSVNNTISVPQPYTQSKGSTSASLDI